MTDEDPSDRFEGTAEDYARYRPGYGDPALAHLVERFDLDGGHRVLDLGCGAGQVAVPLADHVGDVIGMDPTAGMLREARRRAEEAGRDNCSWVVGTDAELPGFAGPVRLTTMGRAFHWLDQGRTLRVLHEVTEPGGGVALLGDVEWLTKGRADWQAAAYEVADRYVADLPERVDPEEIEYEKTWSDYLRESPFEDVRVETFDRRREWSIDAAVGYVRSLSFCSPAALGDDAAAFEADLRERLDEFGGPPLVEETEVEVISARR